MKNKITSLLWVGFAALVLVLISGFVFTFEGFTALKSYGEEPSLKFMHWNYPIRLALLGKLFRCIPQT